MEEGKKISQLPASLAFLGSMELEVNHNGVSEKVKGDQINAFVGGLPPVTSVFGRIGDVVAQAGDYNTDQIIEATAKFWTNARTITSTLTGYAASPGVITAADTVLSAIQKLFGNIAAISGSSYTVAGTPNRISISGTNPRVIDIDTAYVGQASITTVGIIGTGTWRGTPVQVGFGGTGTSTQFIPGSVVFAGVSGVYTQDNVNFRFDNTNKILLLNGATFTGLHSALIIGGATNTYGISVEGVSDVSYLSTITNSTTSFPLDASRHHASFNNTSTTPGSNSVMRFLNNSPSALIGSIYVDGASADFTIAVAKTSSDVTKTTMYIKGATGAVGIGFDFKTPTAFLHVSGAIATQSSIRIGDATAMPTGANRKGGDVNYRTSTGRYYGYKTDNTAEETFAFLSDITGGSLTETAVAFGSNTNTVTSDVTNFYYDLNSKTLKLKALEINALSGFSAIIANALDTVALDITGEVGGIKVLNKSTAQYGISIVSEGDGVISSVKTGLAGDFSGEATVSTFTQKGKITVAYTEEIVGIYRQYDPDSTALGTGSMLYFNDDTISTSNFIQGVRSSIVNFTLANGGFLGLGNISTPSSMITMDGSADREIKIDYNPIAAQAGKILSIISGNAAVGSTNVNAGNMIISTGSSRGTGVGNILFYTTAAGSSGSGENAATAFAIFKGDGRIGLNGITLPAAYLTMQAPNGSYGFNILGKELTASNGYDTGWGMRPATNGISSNLNIYELTTSTFVTIAKFHAGGGLSLGYAGTSSAPARLYSTGASANTTIGTPNTAQHIGMLNTNTTANNYTAYTFYASNSSTAEVLNGGIYGVSTDHTAGTEDMDMRFATIANGVYTERFRISDIGASIFHISGQRVTIGGTIFTSLDSTIGNNIGAAETDMASYTTPINLLAINGDRIKFTIGIQCNNSAVTKTIKVYFKGNVIFNTGALTNPGLLTGYIVIEGIIERYSNTGVYYSVRSVHTALSTPGAAETEFISGLTALNGSTSLFKVTGTATTSNDIELIQSVGEFLPAKQP